MRLRKFFMAVMLTVFAFTSCDNFLTDNLGFRGLLEAEVHDSTATVLNVKVQALPGQGNAYASTDTVKLDVAFQVIFEVDSSYGVFNYWKAYANYEKENQKELTEDDIWFAKVNSLTTEVKILKEYPDIRIIPYCTKHPQINVVMPSGLVNPGTLTPSGAQTIEVGKEYTITMQTSTDYGFKGWKIYAMEGDKETDLKVGEDYTAIEYEPEVSESSKNLGATKATIAIRLTKALTKSVYIEPILYEYPDVIVQFPKAYQDFTDSIGTLTPSGVKKMRTGNEYTVKLVTRPEFGFRAWKIYSVVGDTQVDLFTGGALTEAGKSILLAMEGETTVSKGGANEGTTTASISVELLSEPAGAIYIEPIIYEYSVLKIMNYHDIGVPGDDIYDANAILTPTHGTTRNIIVGEEYTVKIKTSTSYGFNGWKVYELLSDTNGYTRKPLEKGTDYETPFDDSETAEANSSGTITVSTTFSFSREFENPVYIVPNVYQYPRLFVSLGSKYASATQTELAAIGSISPETGTLGRAIVNGQEIKITLKTTESYGFAGWKFLTENREDAPELDTNYYDVISTDSVYSNTGTTATMTVVFTKELSGNVYIEPNLSGYPEAYIQLSNSAAGSITPTGLQKIMLDRDYTISLQTLSEYGFSGWSFYNSSDKSNASRKKFPVCTDGDSIPSEAYVYITSDSEPVMTKDIVKNASLIVYNTIKDTSSSGGSVKASAYIRMIKKIDFICIEGKVTANPIINFATPKYNGDEAGSITPLGSVRQSADNEFSVSVRLNDLYSFDGWQLSNGSSFPDIDTYFVKKSENINQNRSEASAVFKIQDGKSVDGFTISAKTKIRPQVRDTSPTSGATGVVRTPDITIVFTKSIAATKSNYTNYFSIVSRNSMTDSRSTNVIDKFTPNFSDGNRVVTFSFTNKTNSTAWLPSTGYITVTVKNNLVDTEGVMLGKDHAFSFTLGTSGDSEGPIVSTSSLKFISTNKTLTPASSTQAYWGDWMWNTSMVSRDYADSFRTKGSSSDTFQATIRASDKTTGDSGISGYYVIQRLMYVPKGGRLPNTTRIAENDMTFFSEDGTWNGLSGCMKADYEKETALSTSVSDNGLLSQNFTFANFVDASSSSNSVDGIYMFELTAKDKLDNKSGNPARFFIVRDTTAPNAADNKDKVSISGGVVVDGKRYFSSTNNSVTVTGNFKDFGTQGQPWTASKPANMQWKVALSTMPKIAPSTSDWTGYTKATSQQTLTIPSSGKMFYVWVQLKDDLGNESAQFATSTVIYNDVTPPKLSFGNDNFVLNTDSTGNNVLYKKKDGYLVFNFTDDDSGLEKVQFGLKGGTLNDWENNTTFPVYSGPNYSVRATDKAGNEYTMDFRVQNATSYASVSVGGGLAYKVYKNSDGSYSEVFPNISVYDCSTSSTTTKSSEPQHRLYKGYVGMTYMLSLGDEYLDEDGLRFGFYKEFDYSYDYSNNIIPGKNPEMDGAYCYVRSYKLRRNSFDGSIIKSDTINDRNINYIPVSENTLKGDVYIDVICEVGYKNENLGTYLENNGRTHGDLALYAFNKVKHSCSPQGVGVDFNPPVLEFNNTAMEHDSNGNLSKDADGNYYYNMITKTASSNTYTVTKIKESDLNEYAYPSQSPYAIIEIEGESKKYLVYEKSTITLPENTRITASDLCGNSISFKIKKETDTVGPVISVDAPYTDNKGAYWYYEGTNVTVSFTDKKFDHVVYTSGNETKFSTDSKIILTAKDWNPVTYTIQAFDSCGNYTTKTCTVRKDTNDGSGFEILCIKPDKENSKAVSANVTTNSWVSTNYFTADSYDYNDSSITDVFELSIATENNRLQIAEKIWDYKYDVEKFKTKTIPKNATTDYYLYLQCQNSVGIAQVDIVYPTKTGLKTESKYLNTTYDILNLNRFTIEKNSAFWKWITTYSTSSADYRAGDWISVTITDRFGRKFDVAKTFTWQ